MSMCSRRENILFTVDDLVAKFLYYDRKEDEELPLESIEAAIAGCEISADEIVDRFRQQLEEGLECTPSR
jgi:hypothetical protein